MLYSNAVDADFGELLAVAFFHAVAFSPFLLEYNHLVAFDMIQNAGADGCIGEGGFAYFNGTILVGQEDFIKFDIGPYFNLLQVDIDFLSLFDFILPVVDIQNGVHNLSSLVFIP